MKPKIHPEYKEATIKCACGNIIKTRSTNPDQRIEICSACHPFYTGKQKLVDSAGRVEKYMKRYGQDKKKAAPQKTAKPKPPSEAKQKDEKETPEKE